MVKGWRILCGIASPCLFKSRPYYSFPVVIQHTICYIYCGVSRLRCTIPVAMIRFKLGEVLEARGWSVYRLSQESGIRQDVIGQYKNNVVKRAVLAHLSTMCATLKCSIGDLMEYVPDKPQQKTVVRKR